MITGHIANHQIYQLQERCRVVLVAVDQINREASKTSEESKRAKLLDTLKLCKEKFYLTRFETSTFSKKAAKARGKSGINLEEGAYWVTEDSKLPRLKVGVSSGDFYERRIKEYVASGRTLKEKVDLEILATAAIAGVRLFVTVDDRLLANSHISEFVKRKKRHLDLSPQRYSNVSGRLPRRVRGVIDGQVNLVRCTISQVMTNQHQ